MNTTTAPSVFQFNTQVVRTVLQDEKPWFVAADVCAALGYSNTSKAIGDHLDEDERSTWELDRSRGRKAVIINESGLYALVLRSRKPEARKFAKWVTSEVLPSIRKTGEYSTPYTVGPNDTLSAAQAEQLRTTLKIACEKLPKEKQAAFMMKGWAKMKSHFGVSYRSIPQREFSEALSLASRHAAEWEVVDAPAPPPEPERRTLIINRTDGSVSVRDATNKSLIDIDMISALMRDYQALAGAVREMGRRMLICTGDINKEDLQVQLEIPLDTRVFGNPAQHRAA